MIWEHRKTLWILTEWETVIECFGDFVTEIILEQGLKVLADLTIGRSKEMEFQVEETPQISTVIMKGIHCLTVHCHVHVVTKVLVLINCPTQIEKV